MSAFWRVAGMNYLQYITKCTSIARACVKPANAPKYTLREAYHFSHTAWADATPAKPNVVTSIVKNH